ncbi:MAG: hypothetical protein ACQER7_10825 [Bacteroidota bacterium]
MTIIFNLASEVAKTALLSPSLEASRKLFTIYLLNSKGEKIKGFTPIHDATMGGKDAVFQLLKEYLDQFPFQN